MLVTSRSFEEYAAFFALDPDRLPRRVLDCSAGGSGFVAAATERGCEAVAADPAYREPLRTLVEYAKTSVVDAAALVRDHHDGFTYDWYGTPERTRDLRSAALEAFLADRERRPDHYYVAARPSPPAVRGRVVRPCALLSPALHVGRPVRRSLARGSVARDDAGGARGPGVSVGTPRLWRYGGLPRRPTGAASDPLGPRQQSRHRAVRVPGRR